MSDPQQLISAPEKSPHWFRYVSVALALYTAAKCVALALGYLVGTIEKLG